MAARAGQSGPIGPAAAKQIPSEVLKFGEAQSEAITEMQKELLEAYEQISRAWLERMKAEAELWSQLAGRISGARSVPDALASYQECAAQRMQMAAEDGRRLFDDSQKMLQAITRAMTTGWPAGSA